MKGTNYSRVRPISASVGNRISHIGCSLTFAWPYSLAFFFIIFLRIRFVNAAVIVFFTVELVAYRGFVFMDVLFVWGQNEKKKKKKLHAH